VRNRSQKMLEVMKPATDISMKATRRLNLCTERQCQRQEGPVRDACPMWKKMFLEVVLEALSESDKEKLNAMLQATEHAITRRTQELLKSSEHHEEHGEMDIALASMLSIKTLKLGWPMVFANDGLRGFHSRST
jgi:CHAD domain-containing protein